MKAVKLRTADLKEPIGIDIAAPVFTWNCEGGVSQSAYKVVCMDEGGKTAWDSGKVTSSDMHVKYAGRKLCSRDIITYTVTLWDENGLEETSEPATFEMGLLNESDFKASWITGNYNPNKKNRYPVDYFRKKFVSEKKVKKARLYATACGVYEASINGEKCGSFVLAPGITDYRLRMQLQTIDVTDLIKDGDNFLEIALADGWYRGSVGAWGLTCQYGVETKVYAQLEITFEDGQVRTVRSDESWDWSNDGPIEFADNKDGEIVDSRKTPSYNGKAKVTTTNVRPCASNNVAIEEHETFKGKVITSPTGKKILDFGQNMAGYISFTVKAHKGDKLTLRFGELIGEDGELTQKNIQCSNKKKTTPLQKIEYTCKEGINEYKTKFAIFGFTYVEITGGIKINPDDFTAIAVYSSIEETGFFESSNELLNKFVQATKWSTKSNSADIPTDCPTRERHGWTGDAQIFFKTANYLFDYAAFSKKYLRDVYDIQEKDGKLPQIAPYGGVDSYMNVMNGSVGWADVGVLIPYRYYLMNGDTTILHEYYDRMKLYAEFMMKRCGKKGGLMAEKIKLSKENAPYLVNIGQSYGEWAEPKDVFESKWTDFVAPHPEVSTAYTSYIMAVMVKVAKVIGKNEDVPVYETYRDGCKRAYSELVSEGKYSLDTDRQAQLVRPLYMKLLNKEQEDFAKRRLSSAIKNYGYRLGTGFLSTPLILKVLESYDLETAYKLLENEEIPGWLSMPKNGATTIWEGWEGPKAPGGIASLNHYSKGALCEWLFEGMCGINMAGEGRFVIKPLPGGSFTFAKASYNSRYGLVSCGWKKTDSGYSYEIKIPANTTAKILLPDGKESEVTAGEYIF
ncbi:MAG: family 78 glycoside hydrolase catalytic domain [Lachnospiraceae bacterium]|nr:family 78 glycoside hydrolase catalytic domain [Lachnospiraceae bacterium]